MENASSSQLTWLPQQLPNLVPDKRCFLASLLRRGLAALGSADRLAVINAINIKLLSVSDRSYKVMASQAETDPLSRCYVYEEIGGRSLGVKVYDYWYPFIGFAGAHVKTRFLFGYKNPPELRVAHQIGSYAF